MRTTDRRFQEEQSYGRRGQPHEREDRERGLIERVTDEMRSWFGHESGGRRRYDEERGEFEEHRGESMMQGEEFVGPGVRRGQGGWGYGYGYAGPYGAYGQGPGGYYGGQPYGPYGGMGMGGYGSGMGGYGQPWPQQGGMYGGQYQGGMYGAPYQSGMHGVPYQSGMYGQRGYGPGYGEYRGREEYGGMRGREEYGGMRGREEYGGRLQGRMQEGEFERQGMREPYEQRGRHHGLGPKGYRRSDERIMEELCEILMRHPDIDASEIEVKVNQGKVLLTGTVDDRQIKRLVEDLAEDVLGVREVQNQIRVERRGAGGYEAQRMQSQPSQPSQPSAPMHAQPTGGVSGRSREA